MTIIRLAAGITILFFLDPLDTYITFTTLAAIYFGVDGALVVGESYNDSQQQDPFHSLSYQQTDFRLAFCDDLVVHKGGAILHNRHAGGCHVLGARGGAYPCGTAAAEVSSACPCEPGQPAEAEISPEAKASDTVWRTAKGGGILVLLLAGPLDGTFCEIQRRNMTTGRPTGSDEFIRRVDLLLSHNPVPPG